MDQAQAGPSKPPHSVSLKLLDENEGAAVDKTGKGNVQDEAIGIGDRKRTRVDDESEVRRLDEGEVFLVGL